MAGTSPQAVRPRTRLAWGLAAAACAAAALFAGVLGAQGPSDQIRVVQPPADSLVPARIATFLDDIEDDKPVASAGNERHAYNELFSFVFKDTTPEQVAAVARTDVTYAHL